MIGENKSETRISANDNMIDVIVKMSDGNPECMTFLMDLIENSKYGGALGALG